MSTKCVKSSLKQVNLKVRKRTKYSKTKTTILNKLNIYNIQSLYVSKKHTVSVLGGLRHSPAKKKMVTKYHLNLIKLLLRALGEVPKRLKSGIRK